jgi:hypothetical protein
MQKKCEIIFKVFFLCIPILLQHLCTQEKPSCHNFAKMVEPQFEKNFSCK